MRLLKCYLFVFSIVVFLPSLTAQTCVYTFPYYESFEDTTQWVPIGPSPGYMDRISDCWTRQPDSFPPMTWVTMTGQSTSSSGPAQASDSSNYVAFSSHYTTGSPNCCISADFISPLIDLAGSTNPELQFDYFKYSAGSFTTSNPDLMVDISTDTGVTWINLVTFTGILQSSPTNFWPTAYVDLSQYSGQIKLRFKNGSSFATNNGEVAIDNIRIDEAATCPINDNPKNLSRRSCGQSSVTFEAKGNTSPNGRGYFWMNSDSTIVGLGESFTTPPIASTTNWFYGIGALDGGMAKQHVGPLTNISVNGFGNYYNGQWFTAQDYFYLDSITVKSNGPLTFQVRISQSDASGAGNELLLSEPINVGSAGVHQVPVNLAIAPGSYFINIKFLSGSGKLFRADSGTIYPYAISNLVSIDSSNSSGSKYYHTFDWVVSKICMSNLATATADFGPNTSLSIPYFESFDDQVPCWETINGLMVWEQVSDYKGSSLDSNFMFIEKKGSNVPLTTSSLISPPFNAAGYDTLWFEFDQNTNWGISQTSFNVDVWDGNIWVNVLSIQGQVGTWNNPDHRAIDITTLQNNNMQVRFRCADIGQPKTEYWATIRVVYPEFEESS